MKMFSQRKNHFRSVSSSAVGLNTMTANSASTRRIHSWVHTGRDSANSRQPTRSFSAESLHVIPQTKDIESQFQAVLGKCLFEKAVQIAEEEGQDVGPATRGTPPRPGSGSPCSSRAAISYESSGANSPMILDSRATLKLRPTRCTSPLVKGSQSFDSYINKGSVDQLAVAKTRGAIDSPKPSIYRYLRRVKTASDQNLSDFSLKAEFTDKMRENDRERYWRRKQEEKLIEEERRKKKQQEKAEMLVILKEMKQEYEVRKAEEALEQKRIQLEAERKAKEKLEKELTPVESTENQSNVDDNTSVVSSSSKSSKKRSSKRKGGSKKDKITKKGKSASKKSAKKKASASPSPPNGEEQGSASNTPQPILKSDERRRSDAGPSEDGSAGTGQTKRVTFRENLVSSRTIKPRKPLSPQRGSPKKPFPGSSSSHGATEPRSSSPVPGEKKKKSSSPKGKRGSAKVGKKRTKIKTAVEPAPPVEPPKEPEPPVPEPAPPEPVVEPEPEEPKEPVVIVVDEPPEFCPAAEYKTRKQMVEEWLYYRSSSAASRANPPIL